MKRALYHTYRPQKWEDLIGQASVKIALQYQVEHGPLGHAFLFSGPRAVGKTSAARLIAKSANCTAREGAEPCDTCDACVAIREGRALDVVEIDAASNTGVDHVREHIIQNARVAPSQLRKKVFIVDEVHMLSTSAFNALLKTLEEPPEHAIFVLATTELHKVPATIISRCQHFTFKLIPVEPMVALLEEITIKEGKKLEDGVLKRVAYASDGCVRDAQSLLAQVFSLGDEVSNAQADLVLPRDMIDAHARLAAALLGRQTGPALEIIGNLVEDYVHLPDFGSSFLEFLRNLLVFRATEAPTALTEARIDANVHRPLLAALAAESVEDVAHLNAIFLDAVTAMRHATVPTLPLELAIVRWTGGAGTNAPAAPPAASNEANTTPDAAAKSEESEELTYEAVPETPEDPGTSEPPAKDMPSDDNAVDPPTNGPEDSPDDPPNDPPDAPAQEAADDSASQPPPSPQTAPPPTGGLSQFTAHWEGILSELKKENPSLTATLKVGRPISLEGDVVTIAFRFPFHKERLEEAKNRDLVDRAIATVTAASYKFVCAVDPKLQLETGNEEDADNIEPVSEEEMKNVWSLAIHTFGEDGKKTA